MFAYLIAIIAVGWIFFSVFTYDDPGGANANEKVITEERGEQQKRAKEWKSQENRITQTMADASDARLKSMLRDCESQIKAHIIAENDGPYQIVIIDKAMADVYQVGAGWDAIETSEERIKSYRHYSEDSGFINTEYAALIPYETFSGPKKMIENYECEIGEGLSIDRVRDSYDSDIY